MLDYRGSTVYWNEAYCFIGVVLWDKWLNCFSSQTTVLWKTMEIGLYKFNSKRGKLVTDIIICVGGLNFDSNDHSYSLFFAIAWICAWFSLSYRTCLGNRFVLFFITIYLTFSIFMSITLSPHDFSFFWRTTNIRNKSARWKTFSYIKWAFSATRLQNGVY